MPGLHSLPLEVLHLVFSYLSTTDLLSLRRASSLLRNVLKHPGFFRKVRFPADDRSSLEILASDSMRPVVPAISSVSLTPIGAGAHPIPSLGLTKLLPSLTRVQELVMRGVDVKLKLLSAILANLPLLTKLVLGDTLGFQASKTPIFHTNLIRELTLCLGVQSKIPNPAVVGALLRSCATSLEKFVLFRDPKGDSPASIWTEGALPLLSIFPKVRHVYLGGLELVQLPKELEEMPKLTGFGFPTKVLSPGTSRRLFNTLERNKDLALLDLSQTHASPVIWEGLVHLRALGTLILDGNPTLSRENLDAILLNCQALKRLSVRGCSVGGVVAKVGLSCPSITCLHGADAESEVDLEAISGWLPTLEWLSAEYLSFQGESTLTSLLLELSAIRHVDLVFDGPLPSLDDVALLALTQSTPRMEHFALLVTGCEVTDEGLRAVRKWGRLRVLRLQGMSRALTGGELQVVGEACRSLEEISLAEFGAVGHANMFVSLPQMIRNCRNLQVLRIRQPYLVVSAALGEAVSSLRGLAVLEVSGLGVKMANFIVAQILHAGVATEEFKLGGVENKNQRTKKIQELVGLVHHRLPSSFKLEVEGDEVPVKTKPSRVRAEWAKRTPWIHPFLAGEAC